MPNDIFRIEMLPAGHGDCLFVEWGDPNAPRRMLIDGGTLSTYAPLAERISKIPEEARRFELIVLSHIDTDHADGLIRLFVQRPLPFNVKDVWFNGWQHIDQNEEYLGAKQGEFYGALLSERIPFGDWNKSFDGNAVEVGDRDLPVKELPGGMKLTLLSPTRQKLDNLKTKWQRDLSRIRWPAGDLASAFESVNDGLKLYRSGAVKVYHLTSA